MDRNTIIAAVNNNLFKEDDATSIYLNLSTQLLNTNINYAVVNKIKTLSALYNEIIDDIISSSQSFTQTPTIDNPRQKVIFSLSEIPTIVYKYDYHLEGKLLHELHDIS